MTVKSVVFQFLIFEQRVPASEVTSLDEVHFHVVDLTPPAILPDPWESPSPGRK